MSVGTQAYHAHLDDHVTTVATVWGITRRDGAFFGFTDHDRDLSFAGRRYSATSGLAAATLSQNTGLSVDNTEALGVLSDAMIEAEDLEAGLFDHAEAEVWRVNWADLRARKLIFKGHFGEMTRDGAAFRVELRGLADQLQKGGGAVYGRSCSANLGDAMCRAPLLKRGWIIDNTIAALPSLVQVTVSEALGFYQGFFDHGTLEIAQGPYAGVTRRIRTDDKSEKRILTLWEPLPAQIEVGTAITLRPGCDRSFDTCRDKFDNTINFQGFPHLPSEDWLTAGVERDA